MDPITIGFAAVGLGASIFGGLEKMSGARQETAAQKGMIETEQKENAVREQAMETIEKRKQMQILRNAQQARSTALAAATNQGGQFGSGLQGGYGEISGKTGGEMLASNQALGFGRQMFELNTIMTGQKEQYADAQSKVNQGTGIASLGSSLMSSLGPLSNLSRQAQGYSSGDGGGF